MRDADSSGAALLEALELLFSRGDARLTGSVVHELGLMESLVAAVDEKAEGARVVRVRLEIGQLHAVVHDALRFAFEVCARGTSLEGATLEIVGIPARARCDACGAEHAVAAHLFPVCACGGVDLTVIQGRELWVPEVEVI